MNDFFLTMEAIKNGQTWDICRTGVLPTRLYIITNFGET